jgi:hypothetical protein
VAIVGTAEQTMIFSRLLGALAAGNRPFNIFATPRQARHWLGVARSRASATLNRGRGRIGRRQRPSGSTFVLDGGVPAERRRPGHLQSECAFWSISDTSASTSAPSKRS